VPSFGRFLALASGVYSRLVECVYLNMVFRYKSNMDRFGVGLSLFEPEKGSLAVTKTLQIGVSGMAFVIYKVCDPKRLQGLGIESDGTLEITDCENNVVYHMLPSRSSSSRSSIRRYKSSAIRLEGNAICPSSVP
jgi:hypothetical protein